MPQDKNAVDAKDVSVDKLLISLPSTFRSVLGAIDGNMLGIVFVVDANRRLVGSITDGDIRRSLLAGAEVEDEILQTSAVYNHSPRWLPVACNIQDVWALLDQGFRCIPLLDASHRIVDIATRNRVRRFPVAQPEIGEQELSNLIECATTGWISSQGPYIVQFEKAFNEYLGGGHAVAVSNGTVALQLGLAALGIGRGDEVIVPDFTFGASVNAIIHSGATPVLVDVDRRTWTLDLDEIRSAITSRTKAILPVHIYGQPARMDEIREIAVANSLLIIEDCAEALGAEYKKRRVGLDGNCACFSFFANKLITTGEGGMVVFPHPEIAGRARALRDHGFMPTRRYWHEYSGFNFRMTNMQAAIGVAQMGRIEDLRARRKALFERYDRLLAGCRNLSFLPRNDWSENSYWLYTVLVNDIGEDARDRLIMHLSERGLDTRPGFYPMHVMKPYSEFGKGSFPVSTYLAANSISLPTSPGLSEYELRHIAHVFLDELGHVCSKVS